MSEEVYIGKLILRLSNRIARKISKESAKFGVTGVQGRILGFIYCNSSKKDIFQKDIEEDLNIRSSSVTSILQLMEKNDYIKRIRVSEDGRLKKIILTEKGLKIQRNVYNSILKIEDSLKSELSDDEVNSLVNLIHRLSKKIEE